MKSLQGDNPITPLTEKSILLPDNNNQEQFCPLSQLNNLIHQKQQNQNNQLNPTILTLKKNLHYKLNSDHQDLIQRKKNQLRNGYEQQQLQQCPFKPRISHKSIEMKSKDISQPRYLLAKKVYIQECSEPLQTQQYPSQKIKKKSNKEKHFWDRFSQSKQSVPQNPYYVSKVIIMKQGKFQIMKIIIKLTFLFQQQWNNSIYSWKFKSLQSRSINIEIWHLKSESLGLQKKHTTKQTQMLATQHRKRVASEIQHSYVTLNDYDQIYNKNKQKLIDQQERINQERCTFNLKINEAQVKSKYLQSKPQKVNNEVNQSQINITQFTQNKIKTRPALVEMKPANSNVAIERMIKGRVQRQLSQAIIKQRTCNSKKRQHLEEQIYEQEMRHKQPLMFIDVIVDNYKKERIAVNQNDTASKLATYIINKNKIDKSLQENLIKLIQQQLLNH
ncbi:unnamed protein product (macronuclear) [Paramecium tetraurelia]|uniref:Uncharacterized protein n=1 Tax=Paramecium tetraurelia TaxID=5888 RepID=A0D8H0_PARTE|nr:uncharacterized protein GSPATT00014283001 [Paramecium tetraurelia]CAK79337.1 unnamed protein product [Paramecium tetraurelia]|eukprot:XP_001446734.1 hypothetical protein (macronuclear) [Paramecium tetraurelia strain d4-2]